MAQAAGLRNWRGEVIEAKVDADVAASESLAGLRSDQLPATKSYDDEANGSLSTTLQEAATPSSSSSTNTPLKKARKEVKEEVVLRKDEFGRDVPVEVSRKSDRKKKKKRKEEKKTKKKSHRKKNNKSSRASRSPSEPRGRLVGTPPPPDPFRPQVSSSVWFNTYYHGPNLMRIATNALVVVADGGGIVGVQAEAGVAREVASEEDAAMIRAEAEAAAKDAADIGRDLVLRAIEEAKVGAEAVREEEEPVGTRPRRSSGPTTRLTTEARVRCAKWIRSTDRSRKPSKSKRKKLLEWFRGRFTTSGHMFSSGDGSELLESECGPDVSLFLARILVWMAKTVTLAGNHKCFALTEQLECIRIFLASAANAHVYYREFQQVDGLALLIKVLRLDDKTGVVSDANRQLVNELILRISQRGRALKEEISRCGGEITIIRGALAGRGGCKDMESPLWDSCRDVLLEQVVGNPKSIEQVHEAIMFMLQHQDEKALQIFGVQILRHLVAPDSFYLDLAYRRAKERELIPLAIGILQSDDIQLQHEGLELVHSLLQNRHLQSDICRALMEWVKHAAIISEPLDERFAPVQFSREYETFVYMRSQFVHAAQSVSTLMNSTPEILLLMVKQFEILVPLSFALVVERAQSLKWFAAAIAIHHIVSNCREAAAAHLSQIFSIPVKKILAWRARHLQPEDLATALLQSDEQQRLLALQFYQNGWKKPVSSHHHHQLKRGHAESEEDEGDQYGHLDTVDSELSQLEMEVEATLRDFVPELQVPTHYDPESDERDLYCDAMDQRCEHHMRVTLQHHFSQFRSVISSSDAQTPLYSLS